MTDLELMKKTFDYLDSFDDTTRPFVKFEKLEILREVIGLIEDGFTWEDILEHITV